MRALSIGLVGDRNDAHDAHRAIPLALARAARTAGREVELHWTHSTAVASSALEAFDAIWCVPASPYASYDGALAAIRFAREHRVPFLGTCGGFQHALIEYGRNVAGLADADHAESNPGAACKLIAPLACALRGASGVVHFRAGSKIAAIYATASAEESYFCSYGLAPSFRHLAEGGDLSVGAVDDDGDVRAIELASHPFFLATLFQPERSALADRTHPLIDAFVRAAANADTRT
jgi:CTP synthase (UTP-ammonia lyase)